MHNCLYLSISISIYSLLLISSLESQRLCVSGGGDPSLGYDQLQQVAAQISQKVGWSINPTTRFILQLPFSISIYLLNTSFSPHVNLLRCLLPLPLGNSTLEWDSNRRYVLWGKSISSQLGVGWLSSRLWGTSHYSHSQREYRPIYCYSLSSWV